MKKPLLFIGILALIVGVVAFFYTQSGKFFPPTTGPAPREEPAINMWKGISPGVSTTENLATVVGNPESSTQNGATIIYSYPSANQYWKDEVDTQNNAVVFIRERIFSPSDTSLKSLTAKIKEEPTRLYGADHQSGTLLYAFPQSGVAYLANSFQDTVYQVWYFPPTTVETLLSLPQMTGYNLAPVGQPEEI